MQLNLKRLFCRRSVVSEVCMNVSARAPVGTVPGLSARECRQQ
jgi:hypothetical protein